MGLDNSILTKRNQKDCFACRVVSGLGLIGMGSYIYYYARQKSSRYNRLGMIGISASVCILGTSRLLNLYPFNNKNDF